MPPSRWARIIAAVYDPDVSAALDKQARGESLTQDERNALTDANLIIQNEIDRWQRGEPYDPEEETPPAAEAPPAVPDLGPPAPTGPLERGTDLLTVKDEYGGEQEMTRAQYDNLDPETRAGLVVTNAVGGPSPVEPRFQGDASNPPPIPTYTGSGGLSSGDIDEMYPVRPAAPAAAAATPTKPPLPPDPKTPNLAPPREQERPAAPKPTAPAKPAEPPKPEPIWDEGGRTIRQGPLRGAIERAGGKATDKAAARVTREIGDVVQKKGWQGHTGGWRTLAQEAAAAWRKQYETAPNTLHPAERAAFEKDQSSLEKTILDADSPFRFYRESWIGAYRNGEIVPDAESFDEDVRAYGGSPPARSRPATAVGEPASGAPVTARGKPAVQDDSAWETWDPMADTPPAAGDNANLDPVDRVVPEPEVPDIGPPEEAAPMSSVDRGEFETLPERNDQAANFEFEPLPEDNSNLDAEFQLLDEPVADYEDLEDEDIVAEYDQEPYYEEWEDMEYA
jgi:hypothetical protein